MTEGHEPHGATAPRSVTPETTHPGATGAPRHASASPPDAPGTFAAPAPDAALASSAQPVLPSRRAIRRARAAAEPPTTPIPHAAEQTAAISLPSHHTPDSTGTLDAPSSFGAGAHSPRFLDGTESLDGSDTFDSTDRLDGPETWSGVDTPDSAHGAHSMVNHTGTANGDANPATPTVAAPDRRDFLDDARTTALNVAALTSGVASEILPSRRHIRETRRARHAAPETTHPSPEVVDSTHETTQPQPADEPPPEPAHRSRTAAHTPPTTETAQPHPKAITPEPDTPHLAAETLQTPAGFPPSRQAPSDTSTTPLLTAQTSSEDTTPGSRRAARAARRHDVDPFTASTPLPAWARDAAEARPVTGERVAAEPTPSPARAAVFAESSGEEPPATGDTPASQESPDGDLPGSDPPGTEPDPPGAALSAHATVTPHNAEQTPRQAASHGRHASKPQENGPREAEYPGTDEVGALESKLGEWEPPTEDNSSAPPLAGTTSENAPVEDEPSGWPTGRPTILHTEDSRPIDPRTTERRARSAQQNAPDLGDVPLTVTGPESTTVEDTCGEVATDGATEAERVARMSPFVGLEPPTEPASAAPNLPEPLPPHVTPPPAVAYSPALPPDFWANPSSRSRSGNPGHRSLDAAPARQASVPGRSSTSGVRQHPDPTKPETGSFPVSPPALGAPAEPSPNGLPAGSSSAFPETGQPEETPWLSGRDVPMRALKDRSTADANPTERLPTGKPNNLSPAAAPGSPARQPESTGRATIGATSPGRAMPRQPMLDAPNPTVNQTANQQNQTKHSGNSVVAQHHLANAAPDTAPTGAVPTAGLSSVPIRPGEKQANAPTADLPAVPRRAPAHPLASVQPPVGAFAGPNGSDRSGVSPQSGAASQFGASAQSDAAAQHGAPVRRGEAASQTEALTGSGVAARPGTAPPSDASPGQSDPGPTRPAVSTGASDDGVKDVGDPAQHGGGWNWSAHKPQPAAFSGDVRDDPTAEYPLVEDRTSKHSETPAQPREPELHRDAPDSHRRIAQRPLPDGVVVRRNHLGTGIVHRSAGAEPGTTSDDRPPAPGARNADTDQPRPGLRDREKQPFDDNTATGFVSIVPVCDAPGGVSCRAQPPAGYLQQGTFKPGDSSTCHLPFAGTPKDDPQRSETAFPTQEPDARRTTSSNPHERPPSAPRPGQSPRDGEATGNSSENRSSIGQPSSLVQGFAARQVPALPTPGTVEKTWGAIPSARPSAVPLRNQLPATDAATAADVTGNNAIANAATMSGTPNSAATNSVETVNDPLLMDSDTRAATADTADASTAKNSPASAARQEPTDTAEFDAYPPSAGFSQVRPLPPDVAAHLGTVARKRPHITLRPDAPEHGRGAAAGQSVGINHSAGANRPSDTDRRAGDVERSQARADEGVKEESSQMIPIPGRTPAVGPEPSRPSDVTWRGHFAASQSRRGGGILSRGASRSPVSSEENSSQPTVMADPGALPSLESASPEATHQEIVSSGSSAQKPDQVAEPHPRPGGTSLAELGHSSGLARVESPGLRPDVAANTDAPAQPEALSFLQWDVFTPTFPMPTVVPSAKLATPQSKAQSERASSEARAESAVPASPHGLIEPSVEGGTKDDSPSATPQDAVLFPDVSRSGQQPSTDDLPGTGRPSPKQEPGASSHTDHTTFPQSGSFADSRRIAPITGTRSEPGTPNTPRQPSLDAVDAAPWPGDAALPHEECRVVEFLENPDEQGHFGEQEQPDDPDCPDVLGDPEGMRHLAEPAGPSAFAVETVSAQRNAGLRELVGYQQDERSAVPGWVADAMNAWSLHGHNGVVEATSGAGKTRLGVAAVAEALSRGRKVLVVTATTTRAHHWEFAIRDAVKDARVGVDTGTRYVSFSHSDVVVVTAASRFLTEPPPVKAGASLVVGDHAHRLVGDWMNSAAWQAAPWRLGLVTSLEPGDVGFEQDTLPYFGRVVFRVGVPRAVADRAIAPFRIALLGVPLSASEQAQYDEVCTRISQAQTIMDRLGGSAADEAQRHRRVTALAESDGAGRDAAHAWLAAVAERDRILADSVSKVAALRQCASTLRRGGDVMVCARIAGGAQMLADALRLEGVTATGLFAEGGVDTAGIPAALSEHVADERHDETTGHTVVVVCASSSARHLVQRVGRVVRHPEAGRVRRVILLYAAGTTDDPTRHVMNAGGAAAVAAHAETVFRGAASDTVGIAEFFAD